MPLTVTQERNETRLIEMVIVCQRFRDAPLLHDEERRAIGEPPLFVCALGIQRERRGKLRRRLRNNFYIWVVLQAAHNLDGTLAEGSHLDRANGKLKAQREGPACKAETLFRNSVGEL